ncbi:MAG: cation-translocating P-type ATPase [Planctomycetes bacterium]|nr:cation-translocating P-type ATPase [Planctomycetota bacterium]
MQAPAAHQLSIKVDGMTCAHCARAVEKSLKTVAGVTTAEADFASGSVTLGYVGAKPEFETLDPAVRKGGYTLVKEEVAAARDPADVARREQRRNLLLLIAGAVLVLPVMLPHWLGLMGRGWDWAALALAVLIQATVGFDFYKGAVAGIRTRNLGMDVLVSIGMASGLLFGAGVVIFHWALPAGLSKHVYFEAATLLVVFLRLGKYVEARARGNALGALRSLLQLAPDKARVKRSGPDNPVGQVIEVDASDVKRGEVCVVNAGGRIPVDGEVVSGESDVDEAMLTGEPVPVARKVGDTVRAGTIATNGTLEVKASAVGAGTALANIVRLVEEAQRTKAPIQRFADKVSNWFVPVVVGIAVVTAGAWLISGAGFGRAATQAIAVLVIACPCALGIAVPAAVMIGSGAALKRNILVKNGAALERISHATVFAFDKTGTLTAGKPSVEAVEFAEGVDEAAVLEALAVISQASQHPFTRAAGEWLTKRSGGPDNPVGPGEAESSPNVAPTAARPQAGLPVPPKGTAPKSTELAGKGVIAEADGHKYVFGTAALLTEQGVETDALHARSEALRAKGDSVSLLAADGKLVAAFGFEDAIREDAKQVIAQLNKTGAKTVLITGDHEAAALRVATALGIEDYHAGVSPERKLMLIDRLKDNAIVAMVGDGINDAPALARADVGIAIGGGSDVAKETGDLVLMSGRLTDLPLAIDFGRLALRAIRQNLFLSLCYNGIGIPLAAGAFVWAGVFLPPSYAALAMVLSDISVAANSARLAAELRKVKA